MDQRNFWWAQLSDIYYLYHGQEDLPDIYALAWGPQLLHKGADVGIKKSWTAVECVCCCEVLQTVDKMTETFSYTSMSM